MTPLTSKQLRKLLQSDLINLSGVSRTSGVSMQTIKKFLENKPVRGDAESKLLYCAGALRSFVCPEDERPVELSLIEDVKQLLSGTNLDACNFFIYVLNNPDYKNMWEAFAGYTVEVIKAAADSQALSDS